MMKSANSILMILMATTMVYGMYWHAYDKDKPKSTDPTCKIYETDEVKHMPELIKKYKLWPELNDYQERGNPNSTVYGFKYTVDEIWKHQHPEDCSKVNFLINGFHNGGFGSEIHVLGALLGLAMDMNRVYLQSPFVHHLVSWETDNPFCQSQPAGDGGTGKRYLACYYEPWSSCTIYDALGPDAMKILSSVGGGFNRFKHPKLVGFPVPSDHIERFIKEPNFHSKFYAQYDSQKAVIIKAPGWLKQGVIPHRFFHLLQQCSPVQEKFHYYWWRAISTAYILRPNNASWHWIQQHKLPALEQLQQQQQQSFLSIYIRRGDKAIEAVLPPVTQFTEILPLLYENTMNHPQLTQLMNNHQSAVIDKKRTIFLASEDSGVIASMQVWQAAHAQLYHPLHITNVFDRKGLLAERNADERAKPHRMAGGGGGGGGLRGKHGSGGDHHPEEYLSMLLNIHYLVKASGYVCTLSSNFCRVIDELRATVGAKADHPFVDLSIETCGKPPCLYHNLTYLDW